ncbi:hypothetical protein IFM89_017555 [Coptis chinensis]|uniref:Dual specificity protein phosphatase 1 n=1 Tax=Coptis chinensis TaxID=261450 RepID=A0A835HTM3_9MAGN|nr:hypothetical protein IFM89_017555 [Coptis chinensis]
MAQMEDTYREKVAALVQAFYATKYVKEDSVPCQIEEALFLGSLGAALNKDALKSLNITHILIMANTLNPAYPNDFVYKKIQVADRVETDLTQHFDECFDFIDEAKMMGGGVLVHCFAGKSRSVTIVVAYLMKKRGMSLSQALQLVKNKRPQVAPNAGFMSQLQNFERPLRVNGARCLLITAFLMQGMKMEITSNWRGLHTVPQKDYDLMGQKIKNRRDCEEMSNKCWAKMMFVIIFEQFYSGMWLDTIVIYHKTATAEVAKSKCDLLRIS